MPDGAGCETWGQILRALERHDQVVLWEHPSCCCAETGLEGQEQKATERTVTKMKEMTVAWPGVRAGRGAALPPSRCL